jgi:hypothetical protein
MRWPVKRRAILEWARWCALTGGVFLFASGGMRTVGFVDSEFECEQAVARLHKCCPDFDVTAVRCDYSSGCGVINPLLGTSESQCLQNLSCDEIEANDICAQVAQLAQEDEAFEPVEGGPQEYTHPAVCPQ